MKKIITVGVFDFFHLGHLNVLKQAKEHGDYLIVAVHDDKLKSKGVDFLYTLEERIEFIKYLKFVDEVISYERVDLLIESVDFDIFVHGPDQNHQYFQKAFQWCRNNNKELAQTERTQGISSTKLRKILIHKDI
ncbi:MAG: adenylyltransferase/cytidyltransferase family protein [Flavobacteriaceae bacterium]